MIYVYRCPACGKQFEVLKSIYLADRPEKCTCGKEAKRVYTPIVHRWASGAPC